MCSPVNNSLFSDNKQIIYCISDEIDFYRCIVIGQHQLCWHFDSRH